MQTATNEFKKNLKNGYPMYGSCRITLSDGTELALEKDDFLMDANGFSINKSCSGLNFFDIGDVSASELSLRIINYNGRLDECDFEGAKIDKVFVNMEMSDGTVESIPKGTFYVDTQDFNGGIVTLKAYDKIADMDKPYTGSKSGTALSLVSTIADKYGIILKSSEFNNSDYNVEIPTDSTYEYTDREILSYISQITCNYAQIDENGYLVLKWYANTIDRNIIDANSFSKPSEDIVSAGDFSEMSEKDILSAGTFVDVNNMIYVDTVFSSRNIGIADVIITGIKVKDTDDNEYMAGEDGYVLTIYANPLVNSNNAQEIANRVWQVAQYTRFRPMSFDTIQNPLLEIGDCVYVLINGNYYETLITNLTFSIGKFTSITVGAESPGKNASYNAPISTYVKKAINQSANKVSALSSQFAGLITQSLGMYEIHETQADGSTITYLANKPTLAESIGGTVWRMALDIFTVTTNYQGSETVWENGFDSEGNLKANVLEVVGIKFDWAKGGVLELGGSGNVNGKLVVMDKSGNVISSISKDGVNIKSGMAGSWVIEDGYLESRGDMTNFQYGNFFFIDENGNVIGSTAQMTGALTTRLKDGYVEFGAYSSKYIQVDEEGNETTIYEGYSPMTRFNNGMMETYNTTNKEWKPKFYYSYQPSFDEISTLKAYVQLMRAITVEYKTLSQLSSRRYKENIVPMNDDDAKKLLSLNPCHFDYINGDKNRTGMIAEEVESVIPECVTYNDNGKIHGLDYTRFIPYMIKTIQAQEERIKALENAIRKGSEV